ncbi:MerR family transcriptional regulator [Nonomuraea angiospora]|uniref:MerR family transcriptional regulator n=1 Tax=Nonomuraea angiospora TaxID=46172 RepID=UPI00341483A1
MTSRPRRMRPPLEFPLRLPESGLPVRVGGAYLSRLWGVDYRAIARWADVGLIEARRDGDGWRYYYREAVEAFAQAATPVRSLRPGMRIRHPKWVDGVPCRVVEVSLDEELWRIGLATSGGRLAYAPPCSGERIVLLVPPETGES